MQAEPFDALCRCLGSRASRRLAVGLAVTGLLALAVLEAAALWPAWPGSRFTKGTRAELLLTMGKTCVCSGISETMGASLRRSAA